MNELHIAKHAQVFCDAMTIKTRDDGSTYYTIREGAPDWVQDAAMAAHDGGRILPHDWVYQSLTAAAESLAEMEAGDDVQDTISEFADSSVDAYTGRLFAWLLEFPGAEDYADDARSEGLTAEDAGIVQQLMAGQYRALEEIGHSLAAYIENEIEEDEDEE